MTIKRLPVGVMYAAGKRPPRFDTVDFEPPARSFRDEVTEAMVLAHVRRTEQRLRLLLGRWVSELEPCSVMDRDSNLLGLTAVGHSEIYVDWEVESARAPRQWRR